jgi:hypothetical protein
MEVTLLASGIRPAENYVHVLLFNSLLEFNMGVPILYILWTAIKSTKVHDTDKGEPPQISSLGAC